MSNENKWPSNARAALRRYFQRRRAPRAIVSLLLILAGSFGFLVSYASLHFGLDQMSIRYPVALLAGYVFFLGLLRLWVEWERSRFNPKEAEIKAIIVEERRSNKDSPLNPDRTTSWFDWLDAPGHIALDDGCLPGLLALVLFGLVTVLAMAVAAMPALLAEVFLDVFIVSVFYRRLRIRAQEHWLGTALRKTWWLVLIAAGLLALVGSILESAAPGSRSIGPAIEKILHG